MKYWQVVFFDVSGGPISLTLTYEQSFFSWMLETVKWFHMAILVNWCISLWVNPLDWFFSQMLAKKSIPIVCLNLRESWLRFISIKLVAWPGRAAQNNPTQLLSPSSRNPQVIMTFFRQGGGTKLSPRSQYWHLHFDHFKLEKKLAKI
jgi:hypothetical protein